MYIVFGATGFIGTAIRAVLDQRRDAYVGFGRAMCIRRVGAHDDVVEAATLAARVRILRELPASQATIFSAGPALATVDPGVLRAAHIASVQDGFEALAQADRGAQHVIYTSSGLVYGRRPTSHPLAEADAPNPNSPYGEIKLACEQLAADLAARVGARLIVARLFNVTGPGQVNGIVPDIASQARDIRAKLRERFRLRSNSSILDIMHVRDAADGLVRLADCHVDPLVVNICTGKPLTTDDLIAAARHVFDRDVEVCYETSGGRREALVGRPDLMTRVTGWQATTSIEQIVAEMILAVTNKEKQLHA
jgi:nucleoside-diphosphate-sugar epimerase